MNTDFLSHTEIQKIQLERLQETLLYAYANSHFYREFYDEKGFSPGDIHRMEDLSRIPLIQREIISERLKDLIATPSSRWIDISSTAGITGTPLYLPTTKNDLVLMAGLSSRGARNLGITEEDTILLTLSQDNLLPYGSIFSFIFQFAIGATLLRAGTSDPDRYIKIIETLNPNVVIGLPDDLIAIGKKIIKRGFHLTSKKWKMLITTGKPIHTLPWEPNPIQQELETIWNAPCYSVFQSTELGTGLWECPARQGHHIPWDYVIAEIIDPNTMEVLPPGQEGELVFTVLGREAIPLIRYRTGDFTQYHNSTCNCGRNNTRIMAVKSRKSKKQHKK